MVEMMQLASSDQEQHASAERELFKLRQRDREYSLYVSEFQRWVAEINWIEEVKRNALLQGLSDKLKDSLYYCDIL
jgi:hypothetical protein